MGYCTLSDVKAELPDAFSGSTDTSYDTLITSLIDSASAMIDGFIGKPTDYFSVSTDVRYYDGSGTYTQAIDDVIAITELAVAETGGVSSSDYIVWASTDYFTYPLNADLNKKPYNSIVIDIENGGKSHFPKRMKSVKVSGNFGYQLTIPDDVRQAAIIQTIRYFMRAKNAYQDAGANPSLGQMVYVQELDPDIKILLGKYIMGNL